MTTIRSNDQHLNLETKRKTQDSNLSVHSTKNTSLFGKLLANLWSGMEHKNTLRKAYFFNDQVLTYFRYFTLFVNIFTLIWTILKTPSITAPTHWTLLSFLTIWGLLVCLTYSFLVIIWADAPDNSAKWKFTYLLAEVGFALEIMICPFYFAVLFPNALKNQNMTHLEITYQILIHLIVPLLIYAEIFFRDFAFPKGHKVIIIGVILAYMTNNLLWTVLRNKPVYPPIDWISTRSYILKIVATAVIIGAFSLGSSIYKWKTASHRQTNKGIKSQ